MPVNGRQDLIRRLKGYLSSKINSMKSIFHDFHKQERWKHSIGWVFLGQAFGILSHKCCIHNFTLNTNSDESQNQKIIHLHCRKNLKSEIT